ncbi:2 iron, 2 sulfur cluster Hypothetical protein [Nesidiocoris tenuis]|uniref:FAD-binding PCMH-type domain-containing protein n=1 Tax=Nesidiocoris tenuis TaxID=355587 RepID=A0ABN7B1F6_9HEMI|nr:2 iron, 2 sulfur cluster Hypothetical protein [Nesidiocoris tenuis]
MGLYQSALLQLPEVTMVKLKINDKEYTVPDDLPADTSLNSFIREHAHLTGTKFMCLEGGCGACIVSVQSKHPTTGKLKKYSVNSCMVPIYACHGWSVTTVEGLGGKAKGYHAIQKRLAAASGTQCGFCSPGMVMNMNSLLEANPKITMLEVENSFGGNICRCTGYRPILDAFKSLASDAPPHLTKKMADIEDMMCPKSGKICTGSSCGQSCTDNETSDDDQAPKQLMYVELKNGAKWLRPTSVKEVFEIFDMIEGKSYRLVGGNTGQGVYRIEKEPDVWIDLNGIGELHGSEVSRSDGITLGANISLTEAMELFYRESKEFPSGYGYLKVLADHIDLIANVPVRNAGTFAGNLAMKHDNVAFPSDIFLMLETVGAQVVVRDVTGIETEMGLVEFLSQDMNKKLLTKIKLPLHDDSIHVYKTFKIMPRAQNAHAYVNAGFFANVNKQGGYKVLKKPRIVFGGIKPDFVHASQVEDYLVDKNLVDQHTIQGALNILTSELQPDHVLPDATPAYRKGLAESLLYKFILSIDQSKIAEKYKSGGQLLTRPVSSAKQDFDTNRNLWPLNKPMPKLEALIQCSGEAEYTNDIPVHFGQLYGQMVLADRLATVASIDFAEAMKIPGVWGSYTAKDLPGPNSFLRPNPSVGVSKEEKNRDVIASARTSSQDPNFSKRFSHVKFG